MRALKQALLSVTLLLIAVVALNVLRSGRAPAQAPPVIRNGDVDCDGQININDPLVVLNWLFRDGPEPCAIAQENPTCCEELRQEVDALASRVPGPKDIVTLRGVLTFGAQGGDRTIFKVPEDKWFVLTSLVWEHSFNPAFKYTSDGKTEEITLGTRYSTLVNGWLWTTGLAFPPGSEIIASHSTPGTNPPSPFSQGFYLNGYLSGE